MILAALSLSTTMLAFVSPPEIARTPNLYKPAPTACRDIERRVREDQREPSLKLGRLPNAVAMYAVERKIGPCPVPTPVGYHPPSLPGAADHPPQ